MTTTILTGAGAVLDWGAPTTSELTCLIMDDNVFKTKSGLPVGLYLYQLLKSKNETTAINFEHIINLVESIYNFVNDDVDRLQLTDSVFSEMKFQIEGELFSFKDIYKKKIKDYYYPIHGNRKIRFKTKGGYLKCLYIHFIKLIIDRISVYESQYKEYQEFNNLFKKFIESFKNDTVRYYTTNYDRIPAKIVPAFYEGFGKELEITHKYTWFDHEKVTTQSHLNCYYHLHGSIHFNRGGAGWLLNTGKVFNKLELFQEDYNQNGNLQLPSNIITGMEKESRILYGPHLAFFNRFYNDCMQTDNLIIIGYSFSDIHINQAIKDAIFNKQHSNLLKVIIVDYFKVENQYQSFISKLSEFGLYFDYFWDGKANLINAAPKHLPYFLFCQGFEKFLIEYSLIKNLSCKEITC